MATATKTSSDSEQELSKSTGLIVAAIDFGTTFTGFAYSFKSKPSEIYTSKWSGGNVLSDTEKAPTCVLLSPEKKFVAFGYEAEDKYIDLIETEAENLKEYYFFERFKMKLYHTKRLTLGTKIADIHGKEMPALDIFAMVIKHLKECLESDIVKSAAGLQEGDIHWVLTVPAIWSDAAKQFMKEAALKPEAGALYCNTKPLCRIAKYDGSYKFEELPVGHKYIVADLGGGTADISIHEILEDKNLREIYCSNGDSYGGTMIDNEFLKIIRDIFGENVISYMTEHYYDKAHEFRAQFELKKRKFEHGSIESIKIQFPKTDLMEIVQTLNEESIDVKAKKAHEKYGDLIIIKGDKLHLQPKIMEDIFKKACDGIVDLIRKTREEDEVREINTLLLVGGFSGSEYLKHYISDKIPGFRIIEAPEPSLAVLKGAVLFGHNPKLITERIARFSYGFSDIRKFDSGNDPDNVKLTIGGQELCLIFEKLITKGTALKVGDVFWSKPTRNICSKDNPFERFFPIFIDLYKSVDKDPKYIAQGEGCEFSGLMLMFPPPTGWAQASILLKGLVVNESGLTVIGHDVMTEATVRGKLDFLSPKSSTSSPESPESNESSESSETASSTEPSSGIKIEIRFHFRDEKE